MMPHSLFLFPFHPSERLRDREFGNTPRVDRGRKGRSLKQRA